MSEEDLQNLMQRGPIMPKQNRPFSKKDKGKQSPAPKPAIKIAKAEMTLKGFEHTKGTLKEKARLDHKADAEQKSERSKRSRTHSIPGSELRNPESASAGSSTHNAHFALDKHDVPPMNQEIDPDIHDDMSSDHEHDEQIFDCEKPWERDPTKLNPRNYTFKPACCTNQIRPAGRLINKSNDIKEVFFSC